MTALKTAGIFVLAALGELSGTYAVWRWLRTGATPLLALVGLAALFAYAVVQTPCSPKTAMGASLPLTPGSFSSALCSGAGCIDGKQPDRFDWIGAAVVLIGVRDGAAGTDHQRRAPICRRCPDTRRLLAVLPQADQDAADRIAALIER